MIGKEDFFYPRFSSFFQPAPFPPPHSVPVALPAILQETFASTRHTGHKDEWVIFPSWRCSEPNGQWSFMSEQWVPSEDIHICYMFKTSQEMGKLSQNKPLPSQKGR